MLGHHLYPVHRVRAESCTQAFDQLRHAGRAPPGACEEVAGLRVRHHQRAAPQAERAYGPGQLGACKPLAQQLGNPACLRRGLRKAQAHACRWHIAVQQREVEHVHPATPELEERAQFIHQRPGSPAKAFRVGDLGLEVASRRVAFPRHEGDTRIGRAPDGTIERTQHLRREPAGESVARQLQAIADGAHAHRSEWLQSLFRPARTGERQPREAACESIPAAQGDFLAHAREPERSQRRWREREQRR